MDLWDTNPSSNFCDPHWELICRKKKHPGISEISTPPEIAVEIYFHAQHITNTTPIFLPADGEASWLLKFGLLTIRRYSATPIPVSARWQVRSGKAKKG